NSWSRTWEQAGFVELSLAVPSILAARTELLKRLQLYFAKNPTQENGPLKVSSAKAAELHLALTTAISTANASRGDVQVKKQARDKALAVLTKRLRGVIAELSQLISATDGRWLDMGLNMPAAAELPEVVRAVVLEPSSSGHLRVRWNASARADRYRVFKQVVGVSEDFIAAATVSEPATDLNTFSPGNVVRVRITAVNEAGETVPSEVVEKMVA
ncbi:MAG: fibronectin type III domain-containing protein, partial [Verrucomicrobiales bacterium]|nr:fibronectin type III domain-containing protein [Verrucomicrobiales bacterium]